MNLKEPHNYLKKGQVTTINVSRQVHERIMRRRQYEYEPLSRVVDRIIENPVDMNIIYDKRQMLETTTVDVSKVARDKMKEQKEKLNITTLNEILWRSMR